MPHTFILINTYGERQRGMGKVILQHNYIQYIQSLL